ncbi:hypothetical protein ABFX02_06G087500 [Erythranthe guttata]
MPKLCEGRSNNRQHSEIVNIMEESNAMTIEFLRARLLSERSVSKSARQRADELSKRVAELTEQLNFVSLQRKKAEKATADVLAILENHGISDVSEEFDSCSEQDESPHELKARNSSLVIQETSTNHKPRKNETEAYSSSEIESCPSIGSRSLSWKSTKDPQRHSPEKKKYIDSVRRRTSFSSNGSSAKRAGKSCRRIRHRETRSIEELQNVDTEKAVNSRDVCNCSSNGEPVALTESPVLRSNNEAQESNIGHYFNGDMESALQHQAQLIGQYEEEEKAQREWEDKFRENNNSGGTQDSCDPGNHSDVTEELYEMKPPKQSFASETVCTDNQETKQEPQISKSLPPVTYDNHKVNSQEQKLVGESSATEFSFPTSKEKSDNDSSEKQHEASALRTHPSLQLSSSSSRELSIMPRETSNNLGSVLEALQRAKLSLNQKLNNLPPSAGGATSSSAVKPSNLETDKVDSWRIPISSPGLFRLPIDYQFEANNPRALSGDSFLTHVTNRPFITPEIQRSFGQPRLSESPPIMLMHNLDPYVNRVLRSSAEDSYPFFPDVTSSLRPPLNEQAGESSRTSPSSERGLPPVMRLSSSYDPRVGPNMYR